MAYTTIDNPGLFFKTVLYAGSNSDQSITGVGFQPDWVWIKNRSSTPSHMLNDAVRGAGKQINSDNTNAELDRTYFISFDSDGFTLDGNVSDYNQNSSNFVSWNWLAGNGTASNGNGSITSTVSANTTAGFSIVSYTGNASNGASFGHGLGVKPQIVLIKNRDTAKNWVYWQDTTDNGTSDIRLCLNLTNANFNNYHVTFGTNTITLGDTDDAWNKSGDNLIAYCFAEKKGYSKFGSYTGNGNADGIFVYTGFRPAWVMIKNAGNSSEEWGIWDTKRDVSNVITQRLVANVNAAENTGTYLDFLSNGFKMRTATSGLNQSGTTLIYMAFAEHPFVTEGTKAAGTAR